MHSVIDSLHTYFSSLLNSPYRQAVYIAIAALAVLLVGIPLSRAIFRSRGSNDDASSLKAASPSMLGLTSPGIDLRPAPAAFAPLPPSNVTAINEALTVPCIHCGVTIPTREDFCPACGYAQPVKQSFIAAFPA
jgi:hypothetical protein